MIDIIEEPFDVQIEYPVIAPTTLSGLPDGIQRRLARAIAIGVFVKLWFHFRLQVQLHHRLGYSRSATVGIPRTRSPPPDLGIFTKRTGGGKYDPEDIRFQIL